MDPSFRAPPGLTKQTGDKATARGHKDPSNGPRGVRKGSVKNLTDSKGGEKKPGVDTPVASDPQEERAEASMEVDQDPEELGLKTTTGAETVVASTVDKQDEVGLVAAGVGELSLEDVSEREEQLFREFLETEAIAHSEYAEVGKLLGRRTPELVPRSCMKSSEDFGKWLAYLGFDLPNSDHWLRLGLNRADCWGHAGVIKNRMAQAQRVVEYGQGMKNVKITAASWGGNHRQTD